MSVFPAQSGIKSLYHYQKFNPEYLTGVLKDHRVHCSDPSNLNDPWDCRPWFDISCLENAEEKAKVVEWFERLDPGVRLSEESNKAATQILRNDTVNVVKMVSKAFSEIVPKRWGIYCLTPHSDSILMWSHYAENHKGICLEFTVDDWHFARARRVSYEKKFPRLRLHAINEVIEGLLVTKADVWAYEDEYRLLARINDVPESRVQAGLIVARNGFIEVSPRALKTVIVGCQSDSERIKDLVLEHGRGVQIKRAARTMNQYKLQIVDL